MEANDKFDCSCFLELFEKQEIGLTLNSSQKAMFDQHSQECKSCLAILTQHSNIIEMASSLPQFDVSEGLTQKILEKVEKQSTPGIETSLLPIGVFAAFLYFILLPFDSLQSVLGWGASLVGLFGLQMLMQSANSQETISLK